MSKRRRDDEPHDGVRDDAWPKALAAIDNLRAIYNRPCSNRPELDGKGHDRTKDAVAGKTLDFMAAFAAEARVWDLVSQRLILPDARALRTRFQTVFRESGRSLCLRVHARVVFLPSDAELARSAHCKGRALFLDLEKHTELVTPVGPMLDGSLGLRGPREQGLWALYELVNGAVTQMWMCPAQQCPADSATSTSFSEERPPTGMQMLERFKETKEWLAFRKQVDTILGSDHCMRSGPLHSISHGHYEMQGRRPTMEDQLALEVLSAPHLAGPASSTVDFLGLYDGHGGAACAKFASLHLHTLVGKAPSFSRGQVLSALHEAFLQADEQFLKTEEASGSCALVAVVGGGRMFLAHAGDSRAVLCSGREAVRLTEDHKPDAREERARIEGAGGSVVFSGNCWRVTHRKTQMMLATSRSLGDLDFKQTSMIAQADARIEAQIESATRGESAEAAASSPTDSSSPLPGLLLAEPTVSERTIDPQDRFIILACDGVWDVLSDQQACDSVRDVLSRPGGSPSAAARKLAGDAYGAGSLDNISVVVALLHPWLP